MSANIKNAKKIHSRGKLHTVTEIGFGVFEVHSGVSGETYRVVVSHDETTATCNCKWGSTRGRMKDWKSACAHVQAVFQHLAEQTGRTTSAWADPTAAARQHRHEINLGDGVILTTRKTEQPARKSEAQLLKELGF